MKTLELSTASSTNHVLIEDNRVDNSIKTGGFYTNGGTLYLCSHTAGDRYHLTNLATGETLNSEAQSRVSLAALGFMRYTGPVTITPQNL